MYIKETRRLSVSLHFQDKSYLVNVKNKNILSEFPKYIYSILNKIQNLPLLLNSKLLCLNEMKPQSKKMDQN